MEVEEKEFAQYRFEGDGDNGHRRHCPHADVVRAATTNPALAPSDVDTYQHASSYIDSIIAATNASTEYYLPDFDLHRHGGNDDLSSHGNDQTGIGNANAPSDRTARNADRRDR